MREFLKPKTWLFGILIFAVAFGLSSAIVYYEFGFKQNIKTISASTSDNVSGWSWNEKVGWISYNSIDCDKNNNGYVDTNIITNGCNGNDNPATRVKDYGVKIDLTTGHFSGFAWSPSVGWISFNEIGAPDYSFNANCRTAGSCAEANNCSACYNITDQKVYGWAKIRSLNGMCIGGTNPGTLCPSGTECTGGGSCQNNGWISFNCTDIPESCSGGGNPGTPCPNGDECTGGGSCVDTCSVLSNYGVTIAPATSDFSGFAWNANDSGDGGIGWISFNCFDVPKSCQGGANPGVPCPNGDECLGGGSCVDACTALSNYKVVGNISQPPVAVDMTAPNWSYAFAWEPMKALNAKLGWTFSGSMGTTERAYQIKVNKKIDNSQIFDSGKCLNTSCEPVGCDFSKCKVINGPTGTTLFPLGQADGLEYGTAYYWWVQVWDNYDVASDLAQYDTDPDTDNDDGEELTFTTYLHEFPRPNATWFPVFPSQGEEVNFSATSSRRYVSTDPAAPVDCQDDTCDWQWTAAIDDATITTDNASTTIIVFKKTGTILVALTVTDNGDTGATPYYTTVSIPVNVNANLPNWQEVKPE